MAIFAFSGSCEPGKHYCGGMETFSVGVFEVLPKVDGKGTKHGKVQVRVKGPISNPEAVYAKAREVVEQLTAGTYKGSKTIRVG